MGKNIGITFKDEDEVEGVAVGPVLVWDLDHLSRQNSVVEFVPFGEPIPGVLADLGWMTKPQALRIAALCDVELGTS